MHGSACSIAFESTGNWRPMTMGNQRSCQVTLYFSYAISLQSPPGYPVPYSHSDPRDPCRHKSPPAPATAAPAWRHSLSRRSTASLLPRSPAEVQPLPPSPPPESAASSRSESHGAAQGNPSESNLSKVGITPQLTALFTSAAIFASSATVSSFSA